MDFYLISNMYPTKDSPGYGSFVKNVCKGLENNGIKLKYKSVIKGRNKSAISKVIKYIIFYISIILKFFRKYDFLYIHFPNQAIPLLRILCKLKKQKIIVNYHGEDLVYASEGYANKLGRMTEKFCTKYVSSIVVPSEYFKQIVINRNIIPTDRIIVSPSGGINPDYFYPNSNLACQKYHNYIKIGYVGRLEAEKGILEFLETCIILKKKSICFKATIIGYGSLHNLVKSIIEKNRLNDDITLINGLSQAELGKFYRDFDLLIFCSHSKTGESLGLTGIESMACGTPIVGSNMGGIASYLQDRVNGFSVPPGDISAIVKAIQEYLNLSSNDLSIMKNNALLTGRLYYHGNVCKELAKRFSILDSVEV